MKVASAVAAWLAQQPRASAAAGYAVVALAGWAHAAALAWPGSGQPLWWLSVLSLMVLAMGLQRTQKARQRWDSTLGQLVDAGRRPDRGRQSAALAVVFVVSWLSGTFWWLFISLHTYGGLAAGLAVAAIAGLALFLSIYYALACVVWVRWAPQHRLGAAVLFAAVWTMAELARGTWLTGFPWGATGYAHVEGPLQVLPRYVGVYGTGAVAAAVAMLLAQLRWRDVHQARTWGLLAGAAGVLAAAGMHRCAQQQCDASVPASAVFSVALLQGNIPQDEKFQAGTGVPLALDWYARAIHDAPAQLVVAPETAIPLLPFQLMPGYLDRLVQPFVQPSSTRALVLGLPLGNAQEGYTNSVWGFSAAAGGQGADHADSALYQYDKHHLVPFGEFIPPLFRWFTDMLHIPLGDFNRGAVGQPSLAWAGQRIAPNICYEDLFGEELAARFREASAAPTVLVNVSNIGWFGDSLAIDQHLQISRMRTLEFERPMIRATNTGATVVIDHRSVVTHALPRLTRGVLLAQVQGRGDAAWVGDWRTPYAAWASHWGVLPLWLWALIVVGMAWNAQRQRPLFFRGKH